MQSTDANIAREAELDASAAERERVVRQLDSSLERFVTLESETFPDSIELSIHSGVNQITIGDALELYRTVRPELFDLVKGNADFTELTPPAQVVAASIEEYREAVEIREIGTNQDALDFIAKVDAEHERAPSRMRSTALLSILNVMRSTSNRAVKKTDMILTESITKRYRDLIFKPAKWIGTGFLSTAVGVVAGLPDAVSISMGVAFVIYAQGVAVSKVSTVIESHLKRKLLKTMLFHITTNKERRRIALESFVPKEDE